MFVQDNKCLICKLDLYELVGDNEIKISPEAIEAYSYLTSIMDKFIAEKQQKNDVLLMQYKRKLDSEIEYLETEAKMSRNAIIANLPKKKPEAPQIEPEPSIIMDEMFVFDESLQNKEKYVLTEDGRFLLIRLCAGQKI
ncbi:hypothetical protein HK103_001156 [Boothiomyces macroporosus]|uniref:Uncharacterized protein n=1 Tax=Boothiomyces macroporosus TaxID=261099 RepID=A0AAD5UJM9_9FUNG|nr:hypothetical protein HK103_001156 [Boothiomyces macroporosus]